MTRPKLAREIIVCDGFDHSWRGEQIEDMLRLCEEKYSIHQNS